MIYKVYPVSALPAEDHDEEGGVQLGWLYNERGEEWNRGGNGMDG